MATKQKNRLSSESGTRFQMEVPLFLELPKFLFNTLQSKPRIAYVPKTRLIHSAVSIEYWLVTDRHWATAYTALAESYAGKNQAQNWRQHQLSDKQNCSASGLQTPSPCFQEICPIISHQWFQPCTPAGAWPQTT